jgi:hypothetical protein
MTTRASVRFWLAAASLLASTSAGAASGYDVDDIWWVPTESGWGIQLAQQRDVVFATLYVYDAMMNPVWYVATLDFQGLEPKTHTVTYAGTLYATTGPPFPALAFDPALVAKRAAGTMQIVAPTLTKATLTFTVDGVTVKKAIERQTLRHDDYNGTFGAVWRLTTTKCANPADNRTVEQPIAVAIVQSPPAMTMTITTPADACTHVGSYTQEGRLGKFTGTYRCSSGEVGGVILDEMSVQRFGFVGQVFGTNNLGCDIDGSIAAVKR